jgi:hypothetical protein
LLLYLGLGIQKIFVSTAYAFTGGLWVKISLLDEMMCDEILKAYQTGAILNAAFLWGH